MSDLPSDIRKEISKFPETTKVIVQQRMRNASVPVVYEEACKALAACSTIDEGKYWADKAEALAAWAKIYKSDKAAVEAKRLKLHAYRRMGQIAEELRPTVSPSGTKGKQGASGRTNGALSLVKEHGFNQTKAGKIMAISRIPDDAFKKAVSSANPPGINLAAGMGTGQGTFKNRSSDAYKLFTSSYDSGKGASHFRSFCRNNDPKTLARNMTVSDARKAREIVIEIQEWLDTFEQYLPKEAK